MSCQREKTSINSAYNFLLEIAFLCSMIGQV